MPSDLPRDPVKSNTGLVATAAARRMERELAWFRELSAEDRSWVTLVAQAGISAFLTWHRSGRTGNPVGTDFFGTAPRELAQTISLRQTLDLVRATIDTVEDEAGLLAGHGEEDELRSALLRYSREVAFGAAQIYAAAAESRGAWDARLESLVVHAVIRGEADDALRSRASELGWESVERVAVVAGTAPQHPDADSTGLEVALRHGARRAGLQALAAHQGQQLICVLGQVDGEAVEAAARLLTHFGTGPVVVGPVVPHLHAAGRSARAALSGLEAVRAWPDAPRPVAASELLAERALLGESSARRSLVDQVYRPLRDSGVLLETATAYLDSGRGLEATGRVLFVHPNTVRYRLGRISDTIDLDLTRPRDAWVAQVALALGRVGEQAPRAWREALGRTSPGL